MDGGDPDWWYRYVSSGQGPAQCLDSAYTRRGHGGCGLFKLFGSWCRMSTNHGAIVICKIRVKTASIYKHTCAYATIVEVYMARVSFDFKISQ